MNLRVLWAIFCAFVLYGGTIPFNFTVDPATIAGHVSGISWNPLVSSATKAHLSIPDAVQNVIFFVPFGVLGVLAGPKRTLGRIVWVTILGAALSVLVETLQLFTLDRVTSMSDVATNTTGAFLGAIAANSVARLSGAAWAWAKRAGLTENAAFRPWVVAALLIVIAAWEPFDVTLELGTVVSKVRALQHDVWQAGVLTDEAIAIVHYALFGLATCLWLEAVRHRAVVAWAAALGIAAGLGLEAVQVMITSRMPGLEDGVVRAGGALLGIAIWAIRRHHPAPRTWLVLTVVATAVGAAMQQLSPFEIAPAYRPFGLMPFFSDYAHTTFDSLSHVIELVVLYAPLGFVWRRLSGGSRPGTTLGVLFTTLAIAGPVEYLQGWVVGRYPDLTDIAMSLAGGWVGVRVAESVSQARLHPLQPKSAIPD